MHLVTRFAAYPDYRKVDEENIAVAYVTDCDQVVYTTEPLQLAKNDEEHYLDRQEIISQAQSVAKQWLAERYPDWRNPGAYWE